MAKNYWDQDLDEFNPYYSQYYNKDGSPKLNSRPDSDSKSLLRNSENSALGKSEPSFRYSGKGKDTTVKGGKNGKGKLSGKKKGLGALIICLLLTGAGFAWLGTSNTLLGPAMSALMTEATDTQFTSYTWRSARLANFMMRGDSIVTGNWGGSKKYAHMPASFQKRLAKYGIEVEGSGSSKVLKFDGDAISADDFSKFYTDDVEFRDAFTKAKRGRVAGFFDDLANRIYAKLGISRNVFKDYRQTGDSDADVAAYKETVEKKLNGNSAEAITTRQEKVEDSDAEPDANGNKPTHDEYVKESASGTNEAGTTQADAELKARSEIERISGKVSQVVNWGCTALRVGNMISTMSAALEIYQAINYFMSNMENISKMMGGDGDASAINEFLNFMSTDATTEIEDYNKVSYSGNVANEDYSIELGTISESGSPLKSQGMSSMLAYAPIDTTKTVNYSIERSSRTIRDAFLKNAVTSNVTFAGCAVTQGLAAAFSLAVSLSPAGIVKAVGGFALKLGIGVGVAVSVSAFLSFMIPRVARVWMTNVAEDLVGIPAGETLALGASAANSRLGQSGSGQTGSSEEVVKSYGAATQNVLALEAEVDRLNHSPFDITNKNTFLGSIAYSLLPSALSSTSVNLSTVSNLMRTTSSSIAALSSRTYASDSSSPTKSTFSTTFGDCPNLEEIGMVGDAYCNRAVTTDMSTIDIAPNDPTYSNVIMASMEKCDDDGNCIIKDGSELAQAINFCFNRESPAGIVDANILNELEVGNTVLNSMPVVNDVIDIINSYITLKDDTLKWATYEKCGNTEQNSAYWNSNMKYYQRYVEDQRILEQMGAYEGSVNPVTAYIDKYEAEHPVDNSPAGYLARISGTTKKDAELVIDMIAYYDFLESYDADSRIAMDGDTTDIKSGEEVAAEISNQGIRLETERTNRPSEAILANHYIIYADIRNRSYTV